MKKAFDDNLPRFKPRIRQPGADDGTSQSNGIEAVAEAPPVASSVDVKAALEAAMRDETRGSRAETDSAVRRTEDSRPSRAPEAESRAARPRPEATAAPAVTRFQTNGNGVAYEARREKPAAVAATPAEEVQADLRRRKLRSKLAALTAATPSLDAESPRAAQEVLGAAEALSRELTVARERGDRLEGELGRARADLDRAVSEVERRRRDYDELAKKLDGARALLGNLEAELTALEEERDEALYEVGALRAADAERAAGVTSITAELDAAQRQLGELKAERVELLRELDAEEIESSSLRREVARLAGERARLTEQLAEASRAKGALADSRKALEEVHRVLAVARTPSAPRR